MLANGSTKTETRLKHTCILGKVFSRVDLMRLGFQNSSFKLCCCCFWTHISQLFDQPCLTTTSDSVTFFSLLFRYFPLHPHPFFEEKEKLYRIFNIICVHEKYYDFVDPFSEILFLRHSLSSESISGSV